MQNLNKSTEVNSEAFIEFMGKALNLRRDQVIDRVYKNSKEDMFNLRKAEESWGDGRETSKRPAESESTCAVCGAKEKTRGYGENGKVKLCDDCAEKPMPVHFWDELVNHADAGGGDPMRGAERKSFGEDGDMDKAEAEGAFNSPKAPAMPKIKAQNAVNLGKGADEDRRNTKREREEAVARRVDDELEGRFAQSFGKSVRTLDNIITRLNRDFGR